MLGNIVNLIKLCIMFGGIFGFSELLYHHFKVRVEVTRKFSHLAGGLVSLSFPFFFDNHWPVLILGILFTSILTISYRYKLLPSINGVQRFTHGSLLFPLIVYFCFSVASFQTNNLYFFLPILILSISDPLAALSGQRLPLGPYVIFGHQKTLVGSAIFFTSALLISTAIFFLIGTLHPLQIFISATLVAGSATLAEAITHKGYDNLAIPISVILCLFVQQFFQA